MTSAWKFWHLHCALQVTNMRYALDYCPWRSTIDQYKIIHLICLKPRLGATLAKRSFQGWATMGWSVMGTLMPATILPGATMCFVLWFGGCSCVFVALATIFWTDISVTKYGPLACHWQQNCTCTVTISISDFKIWWWRKQILTNPTTNRFLLKIGDHSICGCYLCDASDFQICCIENYNGHTTVTLCQEPDKQIR